MLISHSVCFIGFWFFLFVRFFIIFIINSCSIFVIDNCLRFSSRHMSEWHIFDVFRIVVIFLILFTRGSFAKYRWFTHRFLHFRFSKGTKMLKWFDYTHIVFVYRSVIEIEEVVRFFIWIISYNVSNEGIAF